MREKPSLSQPHWVRSVMQNYYQFINGGYEIIDGKIHVNIDKVVPAAQEMMKEIIRVQLNNTLEDAEAYVIRYFNYTSEQEEIGKKILKVKTALNGRLINELADQFLEEDEN